MKKKHEYCPMDEFVHISIHKDELKFFSKEIQTFIKENARIEFYPNGKKKGKKIDKVAEFKKRLKEFRESTDELEKCIIFDCIKELLDRMMIHHIEKAFKEL